MKNALFSLEGIDALLPGTTNGNKWNGWARPYFDFNQARHVMEVWNASLTNGEGRMRYDAERDAFVCVVEGEEEVFAATEVYRIKMYGIGNASWCWDEQPLPRRASHVDAEQYFGKHAYLFLPDHMNRRDLTVKMLQDMQIVKHPDVLKGLLIAMAKAELSNPERKAAKMRDLFRRVPCRSAPQVRHLFSLSGYKEADLKRFIDRLVEDNGLYDSAEGVKAKKAASFSYDPYDDGGYHQSQYKNVECPTCDNKETVYCEGSKHIETIANWMRDFDYLVGPYVRCQECDSVVRPIISDAEWSDVPPDTEGDPDLWDNHKEYMGELVERLQKHATEAGLPKPTHLMLTASGLDWRNRTGWRLIKADGDELAEAMTINSQFCLRHGSLWLEPEGVGEISVVMYHHDAPMGGSITARPAWRCDIANTNRYEDDEDFIVGDDVFKAIVYGRVAATMLCGNHNAFPYAEGSTFEMVCHSQIYEALREQQRRFVPELDDKPKSLLECYQEMLNQQYDEMIELLTSSKDGMAAYEAAKSVRTYLDQYLLEKEKGPARVIITMGGGLVEEVISTLEGLSVMIADDDTEGAGAEYLYRLTTSFKDVKHITVHDAEVDDEFVRGAFFEYESSWPLLVGSVSHGTLRPQDLVVALLECYEKRGGASDVEEFKQRLDEEGYAQAVTDDNHPFWTEAHITVDTLIDRLYETAPEGYYFGTHPGDGSDFGFWPNEE